MKEYVYDLAQTDLADDEGNVTIDRQMRSDIFKAMEHQVALELLTATAGSFTFEWKPFGLTEFVPVTDDAGAELVVDAADLYPFSLKLNAEAIKIKPSGLDGTWGYSLVGKA